MNIRIIWLIIIMSLFVVTNNNVLPATACESLTAEEYNRLSLIDSIAAPENILILKGIMMVETYAGRYGAEQDERFSKMDNWRSKWYGIMQIRFSTAKWLINKYGLEGTGLCDDVILEGLRNSYAYNIKIADAYFSYLMRLFGNNLYLSILAYNVGPGNVMLRGVNHDPNDYLNKVLTRIEDLE